MRIQLTIHLAALGLALTAGPGRAQGVPAGNLHSIHVSVPVEVDDFSNLTDPQSQLENAVTEVLVASKALGDKGMNADGEISDHIKEQVTATVVQALRHDGYAGRIWVYDPDLNTLTKIIVSIYPARNARYSGVVRAHESGHAAGHARSLDNVRNNALVNGVPAKTEDLWKKEIEKVEDSAAARYHERVGRTAEENLERMTCHAEEPEAYEAEGVKAADKARTRNEPYSPPGRGR